MATRSNPSVTPDALRGVKKTRHRGRRGGRKVQARRIAAIQRELEALQAQQIATDTLTPTGAVSRAEPVVITIGDSDDETIPIPVPPPPIEILDTEVALKAYKHREIPDKVLLSFVRNFSHG